MRASMISGCLFVCTMAGMVGYAQLARSAPVDDKADLPHLEPRDGMTKLIVDGQPFICVAGELHNSTSSDV